MSGAVVFPLVIYYDAACPLCAAEMHALRDHDRDGVLQLVDCSAPGFVDAEASAAGIATPDLLRRIHARDAAGRWFVGVEVFVLAYRAAGLVGAARLWSHPRLRPLWDRLYPWIADNRQWLSRLGLSRAYGWLLGLMARRALRRASACSDDSCRTPL